MWIRGHVYLVLLPALAACESRLSRDADSVVIGQAFAKAVLRADALRFKLGSVGPRSDHWVTIATTAFRPYISDSSHVVLTPISLGIRGDTARIRANWSECDSTQSGLNASGTESEYVFVRAGDGWRHVGTATLRHWDGVCGVPQLRYHAPAG
jgi:hypothetical protein